ncbi:MAG: HelD family protein [Candidatus Excrementavichristensenella sp.]|jgi:DNA helicase-2/ATP-dependent DNA helicase PcrA
MRNESELQREREYTAQVQQLLLAVVEQYKGYADFHDENIRMMLSDAWEELRMKPTALSPQDLEQLSTEINRILARRAFTQELAQRYERMLLEPFFGRIDFREENEREAEKIVIGLYSLKDQQGKLLVHDWRAPVCSLYYDAMPGKVAYDSPSGRIKGTITRKRQYRMEEGRLKYFVDTDVSIDDEMLLDILSRAKSTHMRSIVSTIQREQNAAIRKENARVLSVVGGAGSGKTSVAMHRAAYLMYHQRNLLEASRIAVISPGSAFTEYISTVLPDLGEENTQSITTHEIMKSVIGHSCETPLKQTERLIAEEGLRHESVRFKSGPAFSALLDAFADRFRTIGPEFGDMALGKSVLITKAELEKLYRSEFRLLSPALRLVRLKTVINSRLESWDKSLRSQYEERLNKSYRGRDLDIAVSLAVSQHLQPIRKQMRKVLDIQPLKLYAMALRDAPAHISEAAAENAQGNLIWWEDAPAIAYLMLKLGFSQPNRHILHLLIDEAQDYSDICLRTLHIHYPRAHVTILGDPNQRTCPGMPVCDPDTWGDCFGEREAPVVRLSKCYRSTLPIARMCNALLPLGHKTEEFGREGDFPLILPYDPDQLQQSIEEWRKEPNMHSIAVITRTQHQAQALTSLLPDSMLLTGDANDMLPDEDRVVVGGYHVMKGLEFDAVAVVWPDCELSEEEQRRLYTACSRALHGLCLFSGEKLIKELGIVL